MIVENDKPQSNSKEGFVHAMFGEVYERVFGDFINDLLKLDSIAYPGELQGTYESVNARYQKNKDSFVLLVHGEQVVGYLCYFPVSSEFREDLQHSMYILDDGITPDSIEQYHEGNNYLYIMSVVIHPEYRDGVGIRYLTQAFLDDMSRKNEKGMCIAEMYGTAVSPDGERFLGRLGLSKERPLYDGYKVFRKSSLGRL